MGREDPRALYVLKDWKGKQLLRARTALQACACARDRFSDGKR